MADKLKILCFHGCRQKGETFCQKTGSLRKSLKRYAELIYVEAPHTIPPLEGFEDNDGHSWWFTGPGDTYASSSVSETDKGFTDSVQTVQEFIRKTGPYDGFLGFSQGAAFVAILLSMIEREEFFADLKFAILVAGFKSLCSPHSKYYQQVLGIPSLHVIGETDNIISKVRSEDLMSIFENPQILRHPGGHYVPCSKDQKEDYKRFLEKYTTKI